MSTPARVPTIVFYGSAVPNWKGLTADRLCRLLGATVDGVPGWWGSNRVLNALARRTYYSLSYVIDWLQAFRRCPLLDVEICNVTVAGEFRRGLARLKEVPFAVILHSAAGDDMSLLSRGAEAFQDREARLLQFFGNEYSIMRQKIGFARRVEPEFIASQLPLPAARWLYEDCVGSTVLHAPQALNSASYRTLGLERAIDVGFRGGRYPLTLGDDERSRVIDYFASEAPSWSLAMDIRFQRYSHDDWVRFLNCCKGIIGAESGTYYLEKDDRTATAVQRYLVEHPKSEFSEIHERFFNDYTDPISGKAVSSRHFEPIGTKTCQILLEGEYNGVLRPDEHYISLKKDYSNVEDVVARFQDDRYRLDLVERAFEYVMAHHTYDHRVRDLVSTVLA